MTRGLYTIVRSYLSSRGIGFALAAAVAAALPATAMARDNDHRGPARDRDLREHRDHDVHQFRDRDSHEDYDHADGHVGIGIRVGSPTAVYEQAQVWVPPVYRTVTEQQWIPATYRTVIDHVWVEPVVQHQSERVWVPDRYEDRIVIRHEYGHEVQTHERVLVERGHYANVDQDVVITPGHYEAHPQQELVCNGHWETVTHQELVTPGHFEPVRTVVVTPREHDSGFSLNLRLPIKF